MAALPNKIIHNLPSDIYVKHDDMLITKHIVKLGGDALAVYAYELDDAERHHPLTSAQLVDYFMNGLLARSADSMRVYAASSLFALGEGDAPVGVMVLAPDTDELSITILPAEYTIPET